MMEKAYKFNWSEDGELIENETVADKVSFSSSGKSSGRHVTSESADKQVSKMAEEKDGYSRNSNPMSTLLSSRELPSWALRPAVPMQPNNSQLIAECQGCIKDQGTGHTCDVKDQAIPTFSDSHEHSSYPLDRQTTMPQMTLDPYAWSATPDLGPPPYRPPPIPDRRRDHRYYAYRGYERPHYEEYDNDNYNYNNNNYNNNDQFYPYEGHGSRSAHGIPGAFHHPGGGAFVHPNLVLGYTGFDPGYARGRQPMDQAPIHHRHTTPNFPLQQAPVAFDRPPLSTAAGEEWSSENLRNCSSAANGDAFPSYRPELLSADVSGDNNLTPADPPGGRPVVPPPAVSAENPLFSSAGNDADAVLNRERGAEHMRAPAVEAKQRVRITAREPPTETVLLKETKVDLADKLIRATTIVAKDLSKPAAKSTDNSREIDNDDMAPKVAKKFESSNVEDKNEYSKNIVSTKNEVERNKITVQTKNTAAPSTSEARKVDESQNDFIAEGTSGGGTDPDGEGASTQPPPRRAACAFTIDMSSTVGQDALRLPPNLAKRVAKFPRRAVDKNVKEESRPVTTGGSTHSTLRKKPSNSQSTHRPPEETREQPSTSNFKFFTNSDVQHSNADEDDNDDFDDEDLDFYREKWVFTKTRSEVDRDSSKSFTPNRENNKITGLGTKIASLTSSSSSSPAAATAASPATARKQHGGRFFGNLDRESLFSDTTTTTSEPRERDSSRTKSGSKKTPTALSSYFEDRKQQKQKNRKLAEFDSSGEDDDVSEAETYTIKAADSNEEALAARQKIDLLFRVGQFDSSNDYDDDDDDDDDEEDDDNDDDEAGKKNEVLHTTTPTDLKSLNLEKKLKDFLSSDNPLVQDIKTARLTGNTVMANRDTEYDTKQKTPHCKDNKLDSSASVLQDSDDVICLVSESSRELRKPVSVATSGDLGSTSGAAPSAVSRASSSSAAASGKRVLPHIPGSGHDVVDTTESVSVASNSVSSRSGSSGTEDRGFFEVLSSEAPLSAAGHLAERKATRTKKEHHRREEEEISTRKKKQEPTVVDGQFEIIGDSPELRDDKLTRGAAQGTAAEPVDFQRHSTVRRSWNKISATMTSRGPSHDRNDVRGGTGITSADDGGGGGGGGDDRTHYNRVGKLRSMPFKEEILEKSRRGAVHETVEPSRVRPWVDDGGKNDGGQRGRSTADPALSASSAKSSGWRSDGRKLPDSPVRSSVFRTLSDYSTKQLRAKSVKSHEPPPPTPTPREAVGSSQPTTPRSNVRSSSVSGRRQQKAADVSRDSRPPLSSSHHWNTPSRAPSSSANDRPETAQALSRTVDGRQRSVSRPPPPPLSRAEPSRASLRLPRHSSFDTGEMNRGDRLRASLRSNRRPGGETPNPEKTQSSEKADTMIIKRSKSASNTSFKGRNNSDTENPKLQAYHERMKYDPKKAIMEAKRSNRWSAGSRSDDTDGSYEEYPANQQQQTMTTHRRSVFSPSFASSSSFSSAAGKTTKQSTVTGTSTRGGFGSSRTTRSRSGYDDAMDHSTTSSDLEVVPRERVEIQGSPTPDSIQNVSEEIKKMLQQLSRRMKVRRPVEKMDASKQTNVSCDEPELKDLLSTLVEVKQVLKIQLQS